MNRTARIERATSETKVIIDIDLDGSGKTDISTGVPFFDHLIGSLGHHALFDLTIRTEGDIEIDDHHTVEDTSLCLGLALAQALGDRWNIVRFGSASVPMDEALASAAIDLGGRPYTVLELPFAQTMLGTLSTQNIAHALESMARTAAATLHLSAVGSNDHHMAEAAFKALASALRDAVAVDPRRSGPPSTKGAL